MRQLRRVFSTTTFSVVVAVVVVAMSTAPAGAARPATPPGLLNRPVCGPAPHGGARCDARVVVDASGAPLTNPGPTSGFLPADLQAAYNLPSSPAGAGQTVAIVDAYDDPTAETDLGVYRSQFGIPPCTTANGCFHKVNQQGVDVTYPAPNASWAQEISLDLDMVSATCPSCHILLVEATSASYANLGAAVNTAASTPGVTAISNSYGGPEFSSEATYDANYYTHPGVAITVSSGDGGYGVEFPAASNHVVAVGGTRLARATNARGFTETAWSGAGSGCSAYMPKPSWQHDTGCSRRTVADVAAVADPATGVAVYDNYAYQGRQGWMVFGGTSVASPIVASVYALAGNVATLTTSFIAYLYAHPSSLFDVVAGSNGRCKVSYLCKAGLGYDGPTGLGTPIGTTAF